LIGIRTITIASNPGPHAAAAAGKPQTKDREAETGATWSDDLTGLDHRGSGYRFAFTRG
jgi:hypothetical protein